MENRGKAILGILAAVLIGFAVWTVKTIPEPPAQDDKNEPAQEMEYGKNTIREEVKGRLVWELTTESSKVDVNTQATVFEKADGKYYFEDGRILALKAPKGVYDSKARKVKLTGGVVATMSDGGKLTSDTLEWIEENERLIATGKARISQPGMLATGDRIEAWDQFQSFKATGHAHIERER